MALIYHLDVQNKEPLWLLAIAFILGAINLYLDINILEVLLIPRYLTLDQVGLHRAALTGFGVLALLILILTRGQLGYQPAQENPWVRSPL